jgi:uncharacterized membrane protein
MWLWWLVGLGVLLLFVWAVARAAGSTGSRAAEESPEAILKRRYARGELDDARVRTPAQQSQEVGL